MEVITSMTKGFPTRSVFQEFESEKDNLRAKIRENCSQELIDEYKTLNRRLCNSDEIAIKTIEELKAEVWKNVKADKKYLEERLKDLQETIEMKSGIRTKGLFIDLLNG